MRIIIFIVFIMMIIIFINELKNISSSFFQINYIKDVADINIKKHCNDIYCEAETGRFNIAKNSYALLLPNDFYNTKTYYFMILLIIIIFYINTFYNFIKYNNLYYPYISNDGGTMAITIIKNIPYIFAFLTLVLIIAILIARYAPTETEGYRNYFNTDNPAIGEIHFLNINDMYNNVLYILALTFIVYYISTSLCNPYIYTYPQEANKLAIINQNMTMGYLIITIMLTYLLLNIMNILLSFADNKYPKLNNNNYKDIIFKNYHNVLNNTLDAPTDDKGKNANLFTRENILFRCYTNSFAENAKTLTTFGHDITHNYGDYGIIVGKSTTDANDKIHAVLYSNIEYIKNIDNADNYEIKNIKVNYYFRYVSPLIPHKKKDSLKDGNPNAKPRYVNLYNINYTSYNDLHELKNEKNDEKIIDKYKNDGTPYDAYYMIDNIRIGVLKETSILNKILILFDKYDVAAAATTVAAAAAAKEAKDKNDAKEKAIEDEKNVNKNPRSAGAAGRGGKNAKEVAKENTAKATAAATAANVAATAAATAAASVTDKITTKEDFEDKYKVLLDLLIYFSINEINYWIEYKRKEIYESNNLSNYDYINDTVVPDYEKHTILLNLIKYLKEQKANTKKIIDDAINNNKLELLKRQLIREIEKYSKYDKAAAAASGNKKPFFGKEYNMLSNITEIKENFSADISYGSANTFYEQYFNISNNDTSAYDIEYKIGNYFVKNIKNLIYFIIMIIIIAIVLIIFLYRNEGTSLMAFAYDVMMPLIILLIFVVYISLFMSFNTNYNLNVIYGLFDSSYKRDLNDMNNLIIPFIKLHSNNKDKYDNNYYDLYIITNVLASFLYSDDNYTASKYKNAYHRKDNDNSIYSRDETVDYNEFKKYYNDQFTIINEEFKQDFATIDTATYNKNLRKLYEYIKKTIKQPSTAGYTIADLTGSSFNKDDYIKKFESQGDKIVNIILICLELFGNNKDAYKKMDFIKDNFYFEKDRNGNLIPHKFRFNQSVFDRTYDNSDTTSYISFIDKNDININIYVSKGSKEYKIKKIVDNYMKILSLFHYNYILSRNYTDASTTIKSKISADAKDRGFGEEDKISQANYLHQYKNKRLISLISNTKSFDKKSFILASETFKYSLNADNADNTDNAGDAGDVAYVYTNIIETYNINVSNISDNYLENVVKTICYQVDNRDVIMNDDVGSGSSGSSGSKIMNKNGDAHDNQVNILHKANQCISFDFATNYTANLIMLGIIYSMGLYNNKIF